MIKLHRAIHNGISDGLSSTKSYELKPIKVFDDQKKVTTTNYQINNECGSTVTVLSEDYAKECFPTYFGLEPKSITTKLPKKVEAYSPKYEAEKIKLPDGISGKEFSVTFEELRYKEVTVMAKDVEDAKQKVLRGVYGLEVSNHLGSINVTSVEKSKFSA